MTQHEASPVGPSTPGRSSPAADADATLVAQYAELMGGALQFDRSERVRIRLAGEKAPETVTGLVTNDVLALRPGQGQYAAMLTAKGKIIADVRVFRLADAVMLDTGARAAEGLRQTIRKFVNPRVSPYRDVTAELVDIGVFGVRALEIVAALLGEEPSRLEALPRYDHFTRDWQGFPLVVARVPELTVPGVELFVPAAAAGDVREALLRRDVREGSGGVWEIARIEAGRLEWGVDMDESTLAQEANMEMLDAISFTKGCYVGQETVARIHFRGHVNRHLRRLRFVCSVLPPHGAELWDDGEHAIGTVTSIARSPRYGGIGLGMVRREVADGSTVRVRWDRGECSARVSAVEAS